MSYVPLRLITRGASPIRMLCTAVSREANESGEEVAFQGNFGTRICRSKLSEPILGESSPKWTS
jgi:hypothetical protein